ncbi:mechanosensitive ion channel [Bacillus aerolatus]|uniref:Mechanosensitive ion channel n=1 Tax=Bacillus aerolatus TaxID=2653354 RepID=A0A6I1FW08_9BACI|nr:mechanosensitive ion channel domain-containing protein [Bacillus aerolatus]KAB7709113.1 mechanosensitive ion channel [Bacillus aerolatus]
MDQIIKIFTADNMAVKLLDFCLLSGIILIVKWFVMKGIKKRERLSDSWKKELIPLFNTTLNWLTFYGILLLFLYYFSKESWLFYPLYTSGEAKVTVFLIIVAVLTVSLAQRLVKLFNRFVMSKVYTYYGLDSGMAYTLNRMIYYTVMVIALAISFATVGLDLTAAAALFSVLGIGIGFGMRNVAGNFVSGIIILFERPIEVGEIVEINGKFGRVEKIRLRSTIVKTATEGSLIVPNQHFIEQIVPNRSGAEVLAEVVVEVTFGQDTEKIEQLLYEAVDKVIAEKEIDLKGPKTVRFIDFRNEAMVFKVEMPVQSIGIKQKIESRLRHAIAFLFQENNIQLASQPIQVNQP